MSLINKQALLTLAVVAGIGALAAAGYVWSGAYDVGADDAHTRPVHAALQTLRERSIDTRAQRLALPTDLDDPARIRQGAGNYNAMCTGCHLGPGMQETELSKGLYPAPPNLAKTPVGAAEAFWVIKHGIKASGMPAWGKSMDDAYIWNMAAFLQTLPKLDAAQYQALVASSGGHSHGGGETAGHAHAGGAEGHDEAQADAGRAHAEGTTEQAHEHATTSAPAAGATHVHADGKHHVHAPKPTATTAPAPAPESAAAAAPKTDPAPVEPTEHDHDAHEHQH
jgi:mono/diheme cytochrome c family protein